MRRPLFLAAAILQIALTQATLDAPALAQTQAARPHNVVLFIADGLAFSHGRRQHYPDHGGHGTPKGIPLSAEVTERLKGASLPIARRRAASMAIPATSASPAL